MNIINKNDCSRMHTTRLSGCLKDGGVPAWVPGVSASGMVLVLLNCVPTVVRLDCFSLSITTEAFTPTRCKTAKIHQIEHSPGCGVCLPLGPGSVCLRVWVVSGSWSGGCLLFPPFTTPCL